MNESQPLVSDEDIVSRYPAPIAGAWQRVIATRELLDIHKYLLKVYEATLTYLVVVLASQYHQTNERDTQVDETLRQLGGKVSLGQWTGMLRELCRYYSSRNPDFLAELPGFYLNSKLGLQMSRCCDSLASIGISLSNPKKARYFFEVLTTYRNEAGHRGVDEREMVKVLRPALQELLTALDFLTDYRLLMVDDDPRVVRVGGVHQFRHTVTRLMGKDPLPLSDSYDLPAPLEGRQVYLAKGEGLTAVLNLHPLMIARGEPTQLYLPNSYQGQKPLYFSYQTGQSLILSPNEDELKQLVASLSAASQGEPVGQLTDQLSETGAEAHRRRAANFYTERKYGQAVSEYSHAIELGPKDAIAYNGRGLSYRSLENYDQAVADFSRAIELDPGYAEAYYNRGRIYAALGRRKASRLDLEKASELGNEEAMRMLSS